MTPITVAYLAAYRAAARRLHIEPLNAWEKHRTGQKPQWDEHAYIAAGIEAAVDEMVKLGMVRRV